MKLDRAQGHNAPAKYALIKMRRLTVIESPGFKETGPNCGVITQEVRAALRTLEAHGILDWCDTPETEAFVIRLKDKHAGGALFEYAKSAFLDDHEYGRDVMDLAKRAGVNHRHCRRP